MSDPDEFDPHSEEAEKLLEDDPSEYWSQMEAHYGRDVLVDMNDPYNPNPSLSAYLGETDSSWHPSDSDSDWEEALVPDGD